MTTTADEQAQADDKIDLRVTEIDGVAVDIPLDPENPGAAAEAVQAATAPKPEPFDIVRGVEKYIADTVNRAEMEEHGVAGEIIAQRNKVARLNIAMLRMEQGKKQIKDRLENEVELLDSMERNADTQARMDHEQPPLPFGEKQPEKADDNTEWRTAAIDSLGLKEPVARKLHNAGVTSLGQLEDWRASNGEAPKIAGIGDAARQDIDDAVERYWREHPSETADDDAGDTLAGGNGQSATDAAPEAKPAKKGRGKRVKEREFVDQKTGEPVKKSVLPDAGPSVSEEWANAQKPKMAIAN